jgi:hypothetical protein
MKTFVVCRSWQERLRQAEARKQEESKLLEKSGVAAVKVDNQLPNLVNLNEDPQLSELLLYVIKCGQTKVKNNCCSKISQEALWNDVSNMICCQLWSDEVITVLQCGVSRM